MIEPLTYRDLSEQERYFDNLPYELQKALMKYTTSEYTSLNTLLRDGLNPTNSNHKLSFPNEVEWIKLLDQVIQEAPKINRSFYVYRGSVLYEPVVNNPNYVSTSMNLDIALGFAGDECCLFKVIVTNTVNYVYIKTRTKGEEEILFQRNTHFKMLGVETVRHYNGKDYKLIKIYTVMIEPGLATISKQSTEKQSNEGSTKERIMESFTRYVESMDVELFYDDKDNIPVMIVQDYISEHPHYIVPDDLRPKMIKIAQKLLNSL